MKNYSKNQINFFDWIIEALRMIAKGQTDKVTKNNLSMYKCGKIIRLDMKNMIDEDEANEI